MKVCGGFVAVPVIFGCTRVTYAGYCLRAHTQSCGCGLDVYAMAMNDSFCCTHWDWKSCHHWCAPPAVMLRAVLQISLRGEVAKWRVPSRTKQNPQEETKCWLVIAE